MHASKTTQEIAGKPLASPPQASAMIEHAGVAPQSHLTLVHCAAKYAKDLRGGGEEYVVQHAIARLFHRVALLSGAPFVTAALLLSATGALAQDAYTLNPGDRLAVRVVQWDPVSQETVEFGAMSGTFEVAANGTVSLPLVGSIAAVGLEVDELSEKLAQDLRVRLGLIETPSLTIALAEHRPVYILGGVQDPGAYPFTPGLTVQQALALAGGVAGLRDDTGAGQLTAIRAFGNLSEVAGEKARNEVRIARLQAEMDGADTFELPGDVQHPEGSAALIEIAAQERRLFERRKETQARALEALVASRALLEREIAALEEKLIGFNAQLELVRASLGNLETLVERGLARSPSLLSLQGQLIDLENRELDTQTAIFRARQSISELERERIDLVAARQLEVLRDLQRSEMLVEQLTAREETQRRVLVEAAPLLDTTAGDLQVSAVFRITRADAAGEEAILATRGTQLRPADVIEVELVMGDPE